MKPTKAKKTNSTLRGILICMILLMMVISGGIASIHAYFTDTDSVSNNLTVGNNTIEIVEGDNTVKVKNIGTVPCYIRVFVAMEKPGIELPKTDTEGETANWIDNGDNYYYYENPVDPDGFTDSLFKFDASSTSDNKLIIYAESIQSEAILIDDEDVIDAFTK